MNVIIGGLIEKGYAKDKSKSLILANGNEVLTNHLSDSNIRSRILHWTALSGTCYKCEINDKIEYNKLIKDINNIFKLTNHIMFSDEKFEMDPSLSEIRQLYYFSDAEHITKLIKDFHLYSPLAQAIRELFFEIKSIYEKTFNYLIQLRNSKYPKNTVDINAFMKEWNIYDTKISNNSSSILLCYFNNSDEFYNDMKVYKTDNPAYFNAWNHFIRISKQYKYLGFCPKVPCERLRRLIEFPYEELVEVIQTIEPEYKPIDLKPFYRKLKIVQFNKAPNMSKKNQRKDPPNFNKTVNGDKWLINSYYAKWFTNEILNFYESIRSKLQNWEQYYVDCALETVGITKTLKKITKEYYQK